MFISLLLQESILSGSPWMVNKNSPWEVRPGKRLEMVVREKSSNYKIRPVIRKLNVVFRCRDGSIDREEAERWKNNLCHAIRKQSYEL